MVTKEQALEALDDLDDFARMGGVVAHGAIGVLTRFIEENTKEETDNG